MQVTMFAPACVYNVCKNQSNKVLFHTFTFFSWNVRKAKSFQVNDHKSHLGQFSIVCYGYVFNTNMSC